jgi:signal transduction histidine kinase
MGNFFRLPKSSAKKSSAFPIRTFLAAVALVCAGLAVSAWYGYELLLRLSHDYLNNRGQMVAAGMDSRMRGGPGRRANLEAWSEEIDRALESSGGKIVFMRMLNAAGETMVARGAIDSEAKPDLYVYDYPLPTPRGGGLGAMTFGRNSMPGSIRLGMDSADADFIRRQARIQLAVSGMAIILMIGLSYYFLRTLQRFVALQAREDAERHLLSLGTMAATLAHEIRNPLGAMKGLTQLAQEGLPGSHSAQPLMNTVVSEAERLERLVTDLLTFARPPQPQFVRFDVAGLLADLKSMPLQFLLKSSPTTPD